MANLGEGCINSFATRIYCHLIRVHGVAERCHMAGNTVVATSRGGSVADKVDQVRIVASAVERSITGLIPVAVASRGNTADWIVGGPRRAGGLGSRDGCSCWCYWRRGLAQGRIAGQLPVFSSRRTCGLDEFSKVSS